MQEFHTPTFEVIAKPVGATCNLRCDYCYYHGNEKSQALTPHKIKQKPGMSEEVLRAYISQKLSQSRYPQENFIWQGGEPTLLGVDYFQKIIEIQQEYAGNKKIYNTIQTNGVLLDNKWCEFISAHNFLVGISIDGPQQIHDRYRRDRTDASVFDQVAGALERLRNHDIQFHTLTTVNHANADTPELVYNFLEDLGSSVMQFIPVVEIEKQSFGSSHQSETVINEGDLVVSDYSVTAEQYGTFLISIFDQWVHQDVGKVFIQNFDLALQAWSGRQSGLCVFSETCGLNPVMEQNGDLFSCDQYVSPEHRIGNILSDSLSAVIQSPAQQKFGLNKRSLLNRDCVKCKYRFACHGGCPKHRITAKADTEPGLNFLCSGYKAYFDHIDPYMKFMARELLNRRPPANVMAWINSKS